MSSSAMLSRTTVIVRVPFQGRGTFYSVLQFCPLTCRYSLFLSLVSANSVDWSQLVVNLLVVEHLFTVMSIIDLFLTLMWSVIYISLVSLFQMFRRIVVYVCKILFPRVVPRASESTLAIFSRHMFIHLNIAVSYLASSQPHSDAYRCVLDRILKIDEVFRVALHSIDTVLSLFDLNDTVAIHSPLPYASWLVFACAH